MLDGTKRTKTIALVGIAVLVLLVIVGLVLLARPKKEVEPPAPQPKPPAPKVPETQALSKPRIRRIRRTPERALEILWSVQEKDAKRIQKAQVERYDEANGVWNVLGPLQPGSSRGFTDSTLKKDKELCEYRVTVIEGDHRSTSDLVGIVYHDRAPLPSPTGFEAVWKLGTDSDYLSLKWLPGSTDPFLPRGYVLYADDLRPGQLEERQVEPPIVSTQFYLPLGRAPGDVVSLELAAIDDVGQESLRATLKVSNPRTAIPAPGSFSAKQTSAPSGPITVEWTYPPEPALLGFRILKNGSVVADELILEPGVRRWDDGLLSPGRSAIYSIEAIWTEGRVSKRVTAPPIDVPDLPAASTPRPAGVLAEWTKAGDGSPAIQLSWTDPRAASSVAGFTLEVNTKETSTEFRTLRDDIPGDAREVRFAPPDGFRAYAFRLRTKAEKMGPSEPATALLSRPGDFLVPARLRDYRVVEEKDGAVVLEWSWRYPDLALLKGFRVYQDGVKVADETTLGSDVRVWKSGPIKTPGEHKFQLEAVMRDGSTSVKAPAQSYVHFPR